MPGEVQAELTALAGELNEFSAQRLAEITSHVLDRLDAEVSVASHIDQIAGAELGGIDSHFAPKGRRLGHAQRMEMLSELGRGRSLLSLASGSSALAFLAPSVRDRGRHRVGRSFRVHLMAGSCPAGPRHRFPDLVARAGGERPAVDPQRVRAVGSSTSRSR